MATEKDIALQKEIDDLKKERRGLEKKAIKSINKLLASEEAPEKTQAQKHLIKKEMKAALVSTKQAIREKAKELGSA
jgi:hypothetical protein